MAWEDFLGRSSLWIMPYLTISGIDQVFSNIPIPAEWDAGGGTVTIDSETYQWNQTLITSEGWGSVSQRAQPKSGLGFVGSMPFEFHVSPWWLSYLNDNVDRVDQRRSALFASLAPDDTVAAYVVSDEAFAADSGYVHIGTECIYYEDRDTSSLLTLTRGRYGSWAQYHLAGDEAEDIVVQGGGPIVSDWPLAHRKRFVRLWLAPGREVGGRFVPYSSAPRGTHDAEVWAGLTWDQQLDRETHRVRLDCTDLLQWFNRRIARFPKGVASVTPAGGGAPRIQVAGDNNEMPISFIPNAGSTLRLINSPVIREVNSTSDLAPGLYTLSDLEAALSFTLDDTTRVSTPDLSAVGTWRVRLLRDGTKVTVQISWGHTASINLEGWNVRLDATSPRSIWRELGFEGVVEATPNPDTTATYHRWEVEARAALPTLRVPVTPSPVDALETRRIYWSELTGPAPLAAFSATRNDGTSVDAAFRLGDSFVFEAAVGGTFNGQPFVSIAEKNLYGSRQAEEVYDEWKPDKPQRTEVVRGLGFAGVGELRMLLHLLLGGSGTVNHNDSTYDRLWRVPDFVPADLVDLQSFEVIDDELFGALGRDNWFIADPTTVRDVAQDVLTANQCFVVPTWSAADNRFKIRCLKWEPPAEDELEDAFALDHGNIISTLDLGVTVQTTQLELVNGIEGNAGWDNAKQRWLRNVVSADLTSQATFGRAEPLQLNIRGLANPVDAVGELIDAAAELYLSFGLPYHVVVVAVATSRAWTLQLGDPVTLTHDVLPSRVQAGRGVTELGGKIVGKVDLFRGRRARSARSVLTIVLAGGGTLRYSKWSPCCRGLLVTTPVISQIQDHEYSAGSDPLDVSYFEVGRHYRLYTPGDESGAIIREVTARTVNTLGADTSTLTFDSTITLAAGPVIVEGIPYSNADKDDAERVWLHMSDGDGRLDRAGSDDDPPNYWS